MERINATNMILNKWIQSLFKTLIEVGIEDFVECYKYIMEFI